MSSIDRSITGLVAAQQSSLRSTINYAVAAKQLEALEQQGQAVVGLLDSAVQFSKESGKGGHVDSHG